MADWLEEVAKLLWKITVEDPECAKTIRLAVKRIEKNPRIGRLVQDTRYIYTDPESRFRISYNHHPNAKEIELVALHIFKATS
ncbi:hypothetical protein WDW89_24565 [Deltaproteobacteria bacterium TL4]